MTNALKPLLDGIKAWMNDNGAPLLVENLAEPINERDLADVESKLGQPLPDALRALYQVHDGQSAEFECFIESLTFMKAEWAWNERESLLQQYIRSDFGVAGYHDQAKSWASTPLFETELDEQWWPIANMDSDYLVTHLGTGRVFWAGKSSPVLSLAAPSIESFFETYLERIHQGVYRLDEGFGEYYLQSQRAWEPKTAEEAPPVPSNEVEASVEAVFRKLLSKNLFVSVEEIEATSTTLNVVLALYGPKGFHERVLAHEGLIRAPIAAFKERLVSTFPNRAVKLQFFPVDISKDSYRTYLKNAGYTEADL